MTSCAPLTDLFLSSLRQAKPGSFAARTATEKHDLAIARSMSAQQRLQRLNDIMLLAEANGLPPISRRPIRHHVLRI